MESMPLGEPVNSNENPEHGREMFLEHLRDEIWQMAQEMDVELSAEELRVAWEGSKTEEEAWVPFRLSDRASSLSLRAKDAPEVSLERRLSGAKSLVVRAAAYLRGAPDMAAECLKYARNVWDGKYIWNADDVPQVSVPTPSPSVEKKEEEEIKKAA